MYALILDNRIVQISESIFETHPDLIWIEILNYSEKKQYAYLNNEIIEIVLKPYMIEI
jgi:hypothetical protein